MARHPARRSASGSAPPAGAVDGRGLLAAMLVGLAACAPAAPPPPSAPAAPPPASVAPVAPAAIDPDTGAEARIKADVTFLASPELAGRGTGESGARLAADYVTHRFTELHLAPLGDAPPGAARSYLQAFEARVGAVVEPPALRVAQGKSSKSAEAKAIVTADGSSSGTASGVAVLVGHGVTAPALSWDDYAGQDIEGKIAIVLDGVPAASGEGRPADALRDFGTIRYKLRTAREHKASGVIVVAAGDELPLLPSDAASMGIPGVILSRTAARALFPKAGFAPPTKPAEAKPAAAAVKPAEAKPAVAAEKPAEAKPAAAAVKPAEAKPAAAAVKPAAPGPASATSSAKAPAAVKSVPPKALDGLTIELMTHVTPRTAPAFNVVGLLRARADSPHAGEYIVVGAHYDHLGLGGTSTSRAPGVHAVHPGADDNASGTALLLEVARRFTALPQAPDRNLLFVAFGAEELGTLGSRHFVDHPPAPLDSVKPIAAMINADMVGRMREGKLIIDGVGTSADWKSIVQGASAGLGLTLQFGAEGFGASDHASFTAARVPVAFLFTGAHDDYHMPSDTADRVDAAGVARAVVLAARIALELSHRDARLAFVDAPADPHRSTRGGFRASLGTVPDYAFQGPGVRLSGVRPDAPAARAGLLAGDVILRVGTHAITNIHDFMFALGDLEPGREVEIEVDRGGKRVPIKVIPAPGR